MLDVFKVGLRIELEVQKVIAQRRRCLPRNLAVRIYVPHRISSGFELSQHFCKNPVTGRMHAISPEAGGNFIGSINDLLEDFVRRDWHGGRCLNCRRGSPPKLATRPITAARKSTLWFPASASANSMYEISVAASTDFALLGHHK